MCVCVCVCVCVICYIINSCAEIDIEGWANRIRKLVRDTAIRGYTRRSN